MRSIVPAYINMTTILLAINFCPVHSLHRPNLSSLFKHFSLKILSPVLLFAFANNFLDVFHSCKQFIFVSYSTINLLFSESYTTRQLTFLEKPLNKLTTSCFDFFGISLFIRSINNFLLFFEIVAYWLPICINNACSSLLQLSGVLKFKEKVIEGAIFMTMFLGMKFAEKELTLMKSQLIKLIIVKNCTKI